MLERFLFTLNLDTLHVELVLAPDTALDEALVFGVLTLTCPPQIVTASDCLKLRLIGFVGYPCYFICRIIRTANQYFFHTYANAGCPSLAPLARNWSSEKAET